MKPCIKPGWVVAIAMTGLIAALEAQTVMPITSLVPNHRDCTQTITGVMVCTAADGELSCPVAYYAARLRAGRWARPKPKSLKGGRTGQGCRLRSLVTRPRQGRLSTFQGSPADYSQERAPSE